EFRINRLNPGLNTRFWTRKDVDRSKAFMFAIQKRLKTRWIFRNLESFVGGREKKEYARTLIEVSSKTKLMESIVIAIPHGDRKGHSLATINIEYEWKPPRRSLCNIFDHCVDSCPNVPRESTKVIEKDDEGFTVVKKKKNKSKNAQVDGIRLTKPSLNLHYKRVEKDKTNLMNPSSTTVQSSLKSVPKPNTTSVALKNSFYSLSDEDALAWGDEATWSNAKQVLKVINGSYTEEVHELVLEDSNGVCIVDNVITGASTPAVGVTHD
nr:hypothetical protein [Tanacetum cinerariifolium]